jgi:hypothetical protein
MKKVKSYRKELEVEINGSLTDILDKIDEDGLKNDFGIYKSETTGVKGFTMGRPLNPFEYEGEGLPTENDLRAHHQEFRLNIDMRLSHDGNGKIELLIAEKGTGRHFKFPMLASRWLTKSLN